MSDSIQAIRLHINRLLAAVPVLKKNLANTPTPAPVAAVKQKKSRRGIRRANQETQAMQAIQLSFLWNGDQDRAGNQDQAG